MSVTINSVQVEFHLMPPKITFLQGADMNIFALQDTFREIEETEEGRAQAFPKIIDASGNIDFSAAGDGSQVNALTIRVLSPYVMEFEAGAIPFQTSSGNLLGTFVDSPGAIVQINNAVGSLVNFSEEVNDIHAAIYHRRRYDSVAGQDVIYEADGITERKRFDVTDDGTRIVEIDPVGAPV